eukprot:2070411-Alexandrium_andersonii.AAC.1
MHVCLCACVHDGPLDCLPATLLVCPLPSCLRPKGVTEVASSQGVAFQAPFQLPYLSSHARVHLHPRRPGRHPDRQCVLG